MVNFLKRCVVMMALAVTLSPVIAQKAQTVSNQEETYLQVVTKRAEKIVINLGIDDTAKSTRVRDIIAQQYVQLNTIHTECDAQRKVAKAEVDKAKAEEKLKKIEENTTAKLDKLHKKYIAQLSKELSPEGIEKVKDGMTYGVLPITYKGYQDMIPELTTVQKAQILAYLTEAREKAMDAGSSEEKHKWFGKYKGRINNYLSAAGYDLKKAGEDWERRRKESAAAKAASSKK